MECGLKIVKFDIRILGDSLILYTYRDYSVFTTFNRRRNPSSSTNLFMVFDDQFLT